MSSNQLKLTQEALLGVSCVCQQLDTMKGGRKLSSHYMEAARQRKISAPAGSLNRKIRSAEPSSSGCSQPAVVTLVVTRLHGLRNCPGLSPLVQF